MITLALASGSTVTVLSDSHSSHRGGTLDKIRTFANLPLGWHYGRGNPPPATVIKDALRQLLNLLMLGYVETDAFPGVDGEIMVTAYRGGHCIQTTVETDGSFAVAHLFNGEEDFYENDFSKADANRVVWEFTTGIEQEEEEQCHMSSWSISNTMTLALANSQTWPLRLPAMEAGHL